MFTELTYPFDGIRTMQPGGQYAMVRRRRGFTGKVDIPESIINLGYSRGDIVYVMKEEGVGITKDVQIKTLRKFFDNLRENSDYIFVDLTKKREELGSMLLQLEKYREKNEFSKKQISDLLKEHLEDVLCSHELYGQVEYTIFTVYAPQTADLVKLYPSEVILLKDDMLDELLESNGFAPKAYASCYEKEVKLSIHDFPFCQNEEIRSIVESYILDGLSLAQAINEAIKNSLVDGKHEQLILPQVYYKATDECREYFENIGFI